MPYRRPNSAYYWISYTDATGRRICESAGTTDHAEAKALEHTRRAAGYQARRTGGGRSGISVDAVLYEYLAPRLNPRTRATARRLAVFAGQPLHAITPAAVRDYIAARQGEGAAPGTINKELVMLSAAINSYNKHHGTQLPNAAAGAKLTEPPGIVRYLTPAEAQRLIDAATPAVAQFIRLALYTGLRAEALMSLQWTDVDFTRGLLFIQPKPTPRAKPRPRSIPLHPIAREALLACRMRCLDSAYVFCAERGPDGEDRRILSYKKGFAGACARANIKRFRIHDLRHTFASWLVMSGTPLVEVRDLLGHASIRQTEIYAHLAPENLRAAIGKLPS